MTFHKNHFGGHIHIKSMRGAIVKKQSDGSLFIDLKYVEDNPIDITMTISPDAFDQLFQSAKEAK